MDGIIKNEACTLAHSPLSQVLCPTGHTAEKLEKLLLETLKCYSTCYLCEEKIFFLQLTLVDIFVCFSSHANLSFEMCLMVEFLFATLFSMACASNRPPPPPPQLIKASCTHCNLFAERNSKKREEKVKVIAVPAVNLLSLSPSYSPQSFVDIF